MKSANKPDFSLKTLRVLAKNFTQIELEKCLDLAVENKVNPCFCAATEEALSTLAKASFVRKEIDQGKTLAEAMRELGKRIRAWL